MTARVVSYSAHWADDSLTLMWECLECGIESGWRTDKNGAYARVQELADGHNALVHGVKDA